MKKRTSLRTTLITVAIIALILPAAGWGQQPTRINYIPCGVSLRALSHSSGAPGDEFKMYGTWGPTQGTKIPCINKGGITPHRPGMAAGGSILVRPFGRYGPFKIAEKEFGQVKHRPKP